MRVAAVCGDREVHRLCREILNELLGGEWLLTVLDHSESLPEADLYIWDHTPGFQLPKDTNPAEHFVLADRREVGLLRRELNRPDVNIILKPVTRVALRTFLEPACERWRNLKKSSRPSPIDLRADRDELLQYLLEANLKLQEYEQQRTNFLARAVHDFRAPLTAVSGYCGLLLDEHIGPLTSEQQEVIRRMYSSAKRLSRLAFAMFELSTCNRVNTAPKLDHHDIEECVNQALYEILPLMEQKGIQVSAEVGSPPLKLAFERSQIEQVLLNLLDNACKFTPRNGWVRVFGYPYFWDRRNSTYAANSNSSNRRQREERLPNSFRIDILDSGPGIPADQIERIFEEYTSYQGGADRSGAGLGLAICKMILSSHKGQLWAESRTDGANFSFVLPFAHSEVASEGSGARESVCYAGSVQSPTEERTKRDAIQSS